MVYNLLGLDKKAIQVNVFYFFISQARAKTYTLHI